MEQIRTSLATDHLVAAHINSSREQVWVLAETNPTFPKPLRIKAGMKRWRWTDVLEWEKSLKNVTCIKIRK